MTLPLLDRRTLLQGAGAILLSGAGARAEEPESIMTDPPRRFGPKAPPAFVPDPDVIAMDPSFGDLMFKNGNIERLWTGGGWIEGPAWISEGRFLLLSDTIRSIQYRYLPDENLMTTYRKESFNSNGNTVDLQGRILTCEHGMRRVIRWEQDGSCTVLADRYQDQTLNSPNDIIVNPGDESILFTDPAYGDCLAEGHPDAPGGRANREGKLRWNLGTEATTQFAGTRRQEDHTFRIDSQTGLVEAVLSNSDVPGPNGLCLSLDMKTLYVISTATDPGVIGAGGDRRIRAFDMVDGRPKNGRIFCDMTLEGHQLVPDGMKADVFGNLWCGASGPYGLAGVFCYNPDGKLIGRIRLPQGVSNLTFGGLKRNELYMCGPRALYRVMLNTQGAGLC
ncbi:SMP-30/gluconolactonase/LRE family protein [Gluconobacter morbifer]|uniref:Gluconolactonase n=1 Tax=Gluconobacter morbifer G707 TaxID=1088869 RepID=G6XJ56_9PROT|nr:SMP-30/gluconolactonase/LRE family protein [Gluconobacter morbifer]EHH68172.1 gluconolactonase [Gluconobacter morbifer G707]